MDDTTTTETEPQESEGIRALREDNKRKDEELAELRKVAKRGAFVEAGVPLTGPGKLLFETYSGDLDPEAIKAAAEEYGLLPKEEPEPEPDPGQTQQQVDQQTDLQTLSGESQPPGTEELSGRAAVDAAYARRQERLQRGEKQEDAGAEVFGAILEGAAKGDPAFLV